MQRRARWSRLAAALTAEKQDALVVTHLPDVRYLCGFTGSNAALAIARGQRRTTARLFTDGRYTDQAKHEVTDASVRIVSGSMVTHALSFLAEAGCKHIAFDASHTTVAAHQQMRKALRSGRPEIPAAPRLRPGSPLVSLLREIKDEAEQQALARAASVGCALYEALLTYIEPGMREIDIAAGLEYRARQAGADGMSFDTIVAAGQRSSMPHARATTERLKPGDLVTLDFGIMLDGYCSDMTRTFCVGQGGTHARRKRKREVFEAVLAAQEAALDRVRGGVPVCEVDAAARELLQSSGLAKWFTHSTGHGLGLEIHEGPRIAAKQQEKLVPGMVVTIEPGVYLPEEFGVRIEDTVLVTERGCTILTPAYKGWLEL